MLRTARTYPALPHEIAQTTHATPSNHMQQLLGPCLLLLLLLLLAGHRGTGPHSLPLKRGMVYYAHSRKLPVQIVMAAHKENVLSEKEWRVGPAPLVLLHLHRTPAVLPVAWQPWKWRGPCFALCAAGCVLNGQQASRALDHCSRAQMPGHDYRIRSMGSQHSRTPGSSKHTSQTCLPGSPKTLCCSLPHAWLCSALAGGHGVHAAVRLQRRGPQHRLPQF